MAREHEEWRVTISKFYTLCKLKECPEGTACPKGVNCMGWHDEDDRRRLHEKNYAATPCPNIFDFHHSKRFLRDRHCPEGDDCKYSHNFWEFSFHQNAYKMQRCPYLGMARECDWISVKECPFDRDQRWFLDFYPKGTIKKFGSNNIVHIHGGKHSALDLCPFWHSERDRRYPGDRPIALYVKRQKPQEMVVPPNQQRPSYPPQGGHHQLPPHPQPPSVPQNGGHPQPHYNRSRSPSHHSHYGPSNQSVGPTRPPIPHNNAPPPPHTMVVANQGQTAMPAARESEPRLKSTDEEQLRNENAEFNGPNDDW